ncbi:MAG: D-glycero-beta-D-manno-heptose-7-phosphate kinase [Elusimicrobiota bacterium]
MNLNNILEKFQKAKVLIVGDLILDKFVRGEARRISPEAPVPVIEVKNETYQLGGAGNVANNIVSLGGGVSIVGLVGNDYTAEVILKEFNKKGIDVSGIITDNTIKTSVKTRIIAGHQQVVRFDKETVRELLPPMTEKIIQFINKKILESDAVLVSDYGKGVVTQKLIKQIIRLAKKYKKIITVDPKIENFSRYKFVDCLTPNIYEATAGIGISKLKDENDLKNLGLKIMKKLKCRSVLITQGENGMTLFEKERITHIPTMAKEVFDVTGAGDTVIAVLTLALSCGASLLDASKIANSAAGIVVGKLGTAVVSMTELTKSLK